MSPKHTVLLAVSLLASFSTGLRAEEKVSFVDDFAVEKMTGVTRVLEQPTKRPKPVLVGDKPWETNPYVFGTVIQDPTTKLYRMWYMSYNRGRVPTERTPVLYAESKDGVTWTKPNLGLYEFEGSKENNIVLGSMGFHDLYSPSVVEDPEAVDPARRYKMIFWDKVGEDTYRDGGMHVAFSPDGIRWTRYEKNPVLKAGRNDRSVSDVMDVMQDPVSGKFVVYCKGWNNEAWKENGKENKELSQRIILRSESSDFINWSEPEPVIRHARTMEDPQSYGMPVFYQDGVFLGLLRSYKLPGDERIDIRLMSSRDGKKWSPVCEGQTFLGTGEDDNKWDDGMIFTAQPMVAGDKVRIYYGGWDGPHESRYRHSAIGLAELPAGRFAALTPQEGTGIVMTKPFAGRGAAITVNAALKDGSCRVAVVDELGKELPGFALADGTPLTGDGRRLAVTWKGGKLPSQPVRLKFELKGGAKLYGYELEEGSDKGRVTVADPVQ